MTNDDVTPRRLAGLEERLDRIEARLGGIEGQVERKTDALRTDVIDHMRQIELRLSTAITGVPGAIHDLKTWHQERDNTKSRLDAMEAKLVEMERRQTSQH